MKRLVLCSIVVVTGAISLGCSMGGDSVEVTTGTEGNAVAETCCCEYREEGAVAPSYSEMAQSNCENWGYACVDDGRCEAAADAEAPAAEPSDAPGQEAPSEDVAEDVAEDEAAEEDVAEAAPAPAPVARPTNRTMTRGRTTMSRDGGKTTTRSGTSTRESSGSSSSGSRTMKR